MRMSFSYSNECEKAVKPAISGISLYFSKQRHDQRKRDRFHRVFRLVRRQWSQKRNNENTLMSIKICKIAKFILKSYMYFLVLLEIEWIKKKFRI